MGLLMPGTVIMKDSKITLSELESFLLQEAGIHNVQWDATDHNGVRVAGGIYIYRLQAGSFIKTKKIILMK
jgi:flagellar hook assembly protein FlgD